MPFIGHFNIMVQHEKTRRRYSFIFPLNIAGCVLVMALAKPSDPKNTPPTDKQTPIENRLILVLRCGSSKPMGFAGDV